MQRGHRERVAEPERHELPDVARTRSLVDLVGDEEHGTLRTPQPIGDTRVLLGDARRRVDDEDHRVGVARWPARLCAAHLLVERRSTREPATGVDER